MEVDSGLDNHSRTIIHIDLDCFYAQVEMIKKSELINQPVGVQQKNIVVTSNYVARKYGIKKCMLVSEAKKLCPNLILANGEDLHDYRQMSYKVTSLLQNYSKLVERLGLDENFIDVSELVNKKLKNKIINAVGNGFGDTSEKCECGCFERLNIGSQIAQQMREQIHKELLLTSCAGISHNKLLAKLAGSKHKPNQQTVVFPNSAVELMLSLPSVSNIPGIGVTLSEQLNKIGIRTVADLQNSEYSQLSNEFGSERAKIIFDLSFGVDKTIVKATGRPQSIGIEDSCKTISAEKEVRAKFLQLLKRLQILVLEDGRIPKTIKVTVRKYSKSNIASTRETRQCNLISGIFSSQEVTNFTEQTLNKLIGIIMGLFNKLVDTRKPYHLTLLGLSFTKFLEKPNNKNSLCKFLVDKNIEVQSVTDIENITENVSIPDTSASTSYNDNSESDVESTAKRFKGSSLMVKKRMLSDLSDCESPSKLRVAELKLNSVDTSMNTNQDIKCPPNVDKSVFSELPKAVQKELWDEHKRCRARENGPTKQSKKIKPNTILNYLVKH